MTTYAHAETSPENGLTIPEWTFADKLRKIRLSGGWSQKAIAAKLGVGSSAYAQWEAGNAKPRDVVSIANRLELLARVPAAWTLGVNTENRHPVYPNDDSASLCTPRDLNPEPTGLESPTYRRRSASGHSSNIIDLPVNTEGFDRGTDAEIVVFPGTAGAPTAEVLP